MNGFSCQGFSNQSGPHFGSVVSKVYTNYSENVDNDDGLSQFNHHLTPLREGGEVKSYQVPNPDVCDNCSAYSEHIEYLCQENELLHQLVDNLRKRTKDSQMHSNHSKESKHTFANEVAVKSSVDQIVQQYGAAHEEDKITINRLKSEMDFFKALNQNTESCWRKKLENLQTEKDNVIKELQKFITENTETISRLTKELETAKHSKQDSINQLTTEFDKIKAERKDAQERIFKLVHELAVAESKSIENQKKVRELNKELARAKEESQEIIYALKEKLNNIEEKDNESKTNLDKLTKDLEKTKTQYHLQINKLSKDIEAMQTSKAVSSRSWRKQSN